MRKLATALATLAVAATVVLAPVPDASARPVQDNPVYCGPGYRLVDGSCLPWTWKKK